MPADWQLPTGVDRGLWDYVHSRELAQEYDCQVSASPLAAADVAFCATHFSTPGRLIDLGCGTGRLARHFGPKGFAYLGVDLSDDMLERARAAAGVAAEFRNANLVDLAGIPDESFDYAACLYSTLGMVRGDANRRAALATAARVVKPGGMLVLHVHHRWFRGLGWRRFRTADLTMPQAYGGAPLTLHHFTRREINGLLKVTGWRPVDVTPVGIDGLVPRGWGRTYGYLVAAVRRGGREDGDIRQEEGHEG
jgi:SAM-dependent methyltransferase